MKWPRHQVTIIEDSRVGIFRRIAAFHADMFVCTIAMLPLVCMPNLFFEYIATGEWQWSFERAFFRRTDLVGIFVFFLSIYGMYYYFVWHFKNQKQTLGQHFLGFMLVPTGRESSVVSRAFVAWLIFAWWPFWPWTLFRKKQDYLWDTGSKTKARMVEPI